MRDASDVICVVSAYLAAYNAKAFGVKDYIAQFMFNSPPGLSDAMDLAKMIAMLKLIEPLKSKDFNVWIQTRTGLLSYPLDPIAARAHLAASVYLQMALKPNIIHIVGPSEADHAATADEVIEACALVRRSIENSIRGAPDMTADPAIKARVEELVSEVHFTLESIKRLSDEEGGDPLINPEVLSKSVKFGIMDAPQLRSNSYGKGRIKTRIIKGACVAVNSDGTPISEAIRIQELQLKGEK